VLLAVFHLGSTASAVNPELHKIFSRPREKWEVRGCGWKSLFEDKRWARLAWPCKEDCIYNSMP
jgi:hypothetical protein